MASRRTACGFALFFYRSAQWKRRPRARAPVAPSFDLEGRLSPRRRLHRADDVLTHPPAREAVLVAGGQVERHVAALDAVDDDFFAKALPRPVDDVVLRDAGLRRGGTARRVVFGQVPAI